MVGAEAITIVGPFSGDHGMAEFARHVRAELEASGIGCRFHDVDLRALADDQDVATDPLHDASQAVLFLLNPPEFLPLARQLGPTFFEGRTTIGLWWWEAPRFPADWVAAASLLDEVWAATDYIRERLVAAIGDAKRCPLPAAILTPRPATRSDRAGGFLVTFDYRSTVERKNPEGSIRAYLRAFPAPKPGVSLTVKTQAAERVPYEARRLRRLARGRADIQFIDRSLPRAELDALMRQAGGYLSLHRAEGLGLGLLEAMRAGMPVVATGFSGNLQFTPPEYPLLVPWHKVPIRRGTPLYGRLGGDWAEPDIDHAASLMRRLVEEPGFAADASRMGVEHLARMAVTERLPAFVAQRLSELSPGLRPPGTSPLWRRDAIHRRRASFMARFEPSLRRFPALHKFGMDLHFGRYSLRRRR